MQSGIQTFCIGSGSRCTPLVIAANNHPGCEIIPHFEERTLGFFALGIAKAQKKPVGIIVTSGSALGNLMPAVMEAYHEQVPLVILTADRPPDLLHCGMNQTTMQSNFFHNFVSDFKELSFSLSHQALSSSIIHAVEMTRQESLPLHLNCPFEEPFLRSDWPQPPTIHYPLFFKGPANSKTSGIKQLASLCNKVEKGIIILGDSGKEEALQVLSLAQRLEWPVICDACSPLRGMYASEYVLGFTEELLEAGLEFTAVIQFGKRFVSKKLLEILQSTSLFFFAQILESSKNFDPTRQVTHRLQIPIADACEELKFLIKGNRSQEHLEEWQKQEKRIQTLFSIFLQEYSGFSEYSVIHALVENTKKQQTFFWGNSLPIRFASRFFYKEDSELCSYSNRGLSGIDGLIATALGIAKGIEGMLWAIIGDLSFLYDANALLLLKQLDLPVKIIAINNSGGAIFDQLPIASNFPSYDTCHRMTHKHSLETIAAGYGIAARSCTDYDALKDTLEEMRQSTSPFICEVKTNPFAAKEFLTQWENTYRAKTKVYL